ncbi:hypothetical protein CTAYLR_003133 [Chrysophaeum taylorii]|uniref:Uncharacterized protein n=1 Tax=Chrysophaeum taylorii TaxID=2483200 RepID=A0AAD7UNE4_9STRA|nr:hypothetical protein CTAYLR_003133 [Chrysophaeum taylorii]
MFFGAAISACGGGEFDDAKEKEEVQLEMIHDESSMEVHDSRPKRRPRRRRVEEVRIEKDEVGGLRSEVETLQSEVDTLRGQLLLMRSSSSPKKKKKKTPQQQKLAWKEEVEDDDLDVEGYLLNAVVTGIDEPSFYLLCSTRTQETQLRPQEGTFWIILAVGTLLTFITILLPLAMLANFYERIEFFDFRVPPVTPAARADSHKALLKFTSAFLLFFLLYTSLSVLDELLIFRFFLLLPKQDASSSSFQGHLVLDPKSLINDGLNFAKNLIIATTDPLKRPVLLMGIASKSVSLVTVFQLTFIIFRTEFTPVAMILNSVALQFLLDADKTLVAAMRASPSLKAFYAKAVTSLREEAEKAVDLPRFVSMICEPRTLTSAELVRQSVPVEYAQNLAARFPLALSWVARDGAAAPAKQEEEAEEEENGLTEHERFTLIIQKRRCARSELFHRYFNRFIYVYGGTIVFLQIFGSVVCGSTSICDFINSGGGSSGGNSHPTPMPTFPILTLPPALANL